MMAKGEMGAEGTLGAVYGKSMAELEEAARSRLEEFFEGKSEVLQEAGWVVDWMLDIEEFAKSMDGATPIYKATILFRVSRAISPAPSYARRS